MIQDGYREFIQAMEDDISFEYAWSTVQHTYPLLAKFFGGLAIVFPGTNTVESDISTIGVEKSAYRQSVTWRDSCSVSNLSYWNVLQHH